MKSKNKFKFKKLLTMVAVITMVTLSSESVFAQSLVENSTIVNNTGNQIITSNNLDLNKTVTYTTVASNGEKITVKIQALSAATATTKSWKVYYTGLSINCSFRMDVKNNKVTKVYDKWILILGGTQYNTSLTKKDSYGKLSFDVSGLGGWIGCTCWIKGTVTGKNNNIKISYVM